MPSSKILLHVNDDERELSSFSRAMQQLEWKVTVERARSADEARNYLERVFAGESLRCPDGIICDLKAAFSEALDLWRWVQQRSIARDILFLILTDDDLPGRDLLSCSRDGLLLLPRVPTK